MGAPFCLPFGPPCVRGPSGVLRPGFPASLAKEASGAPGARSGPVPPSRLLPDDWEGISRALPHPSPWHRRHLPGPAGKERMGVDG